jgi:hypothetical protein
MIIFIDSSILGQLCNPNSTDDYLGGVWQVIVYRHVGIAKRTATQGFDDAIAGSQDMSRL